MDPVRQIKGLKFIFNIINPSLDLNPPPKGPATLWTTNHTNTPPPALKRNSKFPKSHQSQLNEYWLQSEEKNLK